MVSTRPDWVLSRQRAWGPFVQKGLEPIMRTSFLRIKLNERLADILKKEGADAWFQEGKGTIFRRIVSPYEYEQVMDILVCLTQDRPTPMFCDRSDGVAG